MKFTNEVLNMMSKVELIKHITDLYNLIEDEQKQVKNKNAIYFTGAPKWAKDYHDKALRQAREGRNE